MNKGLISLILLSAICSGLTACVERKVEYFGLNFVVTKDFAVRHDESLPNTFRLLSNYYLDSNCNSKVYVPNVVFIRPDLDQPNREELVSPLSSLNQFRKSIGLLSAVNLIQDYDENLASLKAPTILAEKSTKPIVPETLRTDYPNAIDLKLKESGGGEIENLRRQISATLCQQIDPGEIFLVVDAGQVIGPEIPPELQANADRDYQALAEECNTAVKGSKEGQVEKGEIRKIQQKLAKAQLAYTWDYRFTYEWAKLAIYGTRTHDEAFNLLYLSCEKAIGNGDADKMRRNIESDRLIHFERLSHGHPEWDVIVNALETKDDKPCRQYTPIDRKVQQH